MCGFAGYLGQHEETRGSERLLNTMGDAIGHRGPDDGGVWSDGEAGIGLSHRRLSIIDLSQAGHQPMVSASGRWVLVFNGEIYNHRALRVALGKAGAAPKWRGDSDTETLLAGFDAWGVQSTIEMSIGMFAFALWDRHTRELILGRDRIGEKPLYYGWQGRTFLFGSELKALRAHPAFRAEVDRNALALMMRHNCIPAPYCIYRDVAKLEPGCLLTVSLASREPHIVRYWSGKKVIEAGLARPFSGSGEDAVAELEALLKDAIGLQMVADVPVGVFLSGGVDSSTIAALMQAQSGRPIRTFSIGFHEDIYDEAGFARSVSRHLGAEHTELYVTASHGVDLIPRLPSLYDEPFADSSQIPTYMVSQLTKGHVAVALSGDGGDELFGGYSRYVITSRVWKYLSCLPIGVRAKIAEAITWLSPLEWDAVAKAVSYVLPKRMSGFGLGDLLHKSAGVLASRSLSALHYGLVSHWSDPGAVVIGASEPATVFTDLMRQPEVKNDIERMMAIDMLSYLPDDILVKVDRASMGTSLEARVPFLDRRVVEFAWRLPLKYKVRNGVGKWALRQVLFKYVPEALFNRPKHGFGVPIGTWLRGPLRDWGESLLDQRRLEREGYFAPTPIRQKWAEHLSGRRNWQHHLWDVLMFQAWLENEGIR